MSSFGYEYLLGCKSSLFRLSLYFMQKVSVSKYPGLGSASQDEIRLTLIDLLYQFLGKGLEFNSSKLISTLNSVYPRLAQWSSNK